MTHFYLINQEINYVKLLVSLQGRTKESTQSYRKQIKLWTMWPYVDLLTHVNLLGIFVLHSHMMCLHWPTPSHC